MHIVAHRGLRDEKPENTVPSIAAALSLPGIKGVEFDVELTADEGCVVLHQETLVPTADYRGVQPASRDFVTRDWVIENDAAKLVTMDAGSWMSPEFSDIRVPSLKEVLGLQWGNVEAYVELKDATYWGKRDPERPQRVVRAALPDLCLCGASVNVISFNPEILIQVRNAVAGMPVTLALWTEWRSRIDQAMMEATRCGASAISLPDILILEDPEWIRAAHECDLKAYAYPVSPARGEPDFLTWTASSQVDKWVRLEALGVDTIFSDFPAESLRILSPQKGGHFPLP